jgi:hypothetical protein
MRRSWWVALLCGCLCVWFLASGTAALAAGQWMPGLWAVCVAYVLWRGHRHYRLEWHVQRSEVGADRG